MEVWLESGGEEVCGHSAEEGDDTPSDVKISFLTLHLMSENCETLFSQLPSRRATWHPQM